MKMMQILQIPSLLRMLNVINPTTHGRLFIQRLAQKLGALPRDGRYHLPSGFRMDLKMDNYMDISAYFDSFEYQIRRLIRRHLPRDGVFIDIGANIGFHSLGASRLVGPNGLVLAFEPHPNTYESFLHNIEINSFSNITTYNCALSEETGEAVLYSPQNGHHGGSSLRNQGWEERVDTFTVPTKRLDDVLPDDLERVDFIKIDIEGAELFAIRGAEKTISRFHPAILCEYYKDTDARFGYQPIDIPKQILAFCPDYKMCLLPDNHSVVSLSLDELAEMSFVRGDILMY